jgi:AcrR family transcriptional regulator
MTDTLSTRSRSTDLAEPGERPLRADARRNRERILESARAVFSEDGVEAQIDDVARRAGVGVGTVYRHFPTKEALMTELVRQKFRTMSDRAREALEWEGEPFEVLVKLLGTNAAELRRDANMQQTLVGAGEHVWARAQAEQDELLALTGELIDRAKRAGTIRADATPYDIGMLMSGVCATMARSGGAFSWERHLSLVIDALRPVSRDASETQVTGRS